MNILRMVHPQHGATNVYDAAEKKWHEERGWKVQTDEELQAILAAKRGVPVLTEAYAAQAPAPQVVATVTPLRRGRPKKVS